MLAERGSASSAYDNRVMQKRPGKRKRRSRGLIWVLVLSRIRAGRGLAAQKQPEYQGVRDEEQRHQDGHDEVAGTQVAWVEPDSIALIEG
jgi:hypothetical protein